MNGAKASPPSIGFASAKSLPHCFQYSKFLPKYGTGHRCGNLQDFEMPINTAARCARQLSCPPHLQRINAWLRTDVSLLWSYCPAYRFPAMAPCGAPRGMAGCSIFRRKQCSATWSRKRSRPGWCGGSITESARCLPARRRASNAGSHPHSLERRRLEQRPGHIEPRHRTRSALDPSANPGARSGRADHHA